MNQTETKMNQMSLIQAKVHINLIAAAVLSLFAAAHDSGAALRAQIDSETNGSTAIGDLTQRSEAVIDKASDAIAKIVVVREEITAAGVNGQPFVVYVKYLKDVAGQMTDNNLKQAFLSMIPHLGSSSDAFLDHFLDGMAKELIGMKTVAVEIDEVVSQLSSKGAGAFANSEDHYGLKSPGYLHRQMLASHDNVVTAFAAVEELLNAVIAAEKGKSYLGITFKSDIATGDDSSQGTGEKLATA
jgi:hypothetical protein